VNLPRRSVTRLFDLISCHARFVLRSLLPLVQLLANLELHVTDLFGDLLPGVLRFVFE
jgi:hypothetical protein